MTIIKLPILNNGTYINQEWNSNDPIPDSYISIPLEFMEVWEQYKPFVSVTISNGVIINVTGNTAASNTWYSEQNATVLQQLQEQKQEDNKKALADFFKNNPITWTNGKQYGVTEEDQQELSLNMMQYQVATSAGVPTILEWHAVKEECTTWALEDLTALLLTISSFVYPYIRQMQAIKVQIYATTTVEELDAIQISYV